MKMGWLAMAPYDEEGVGSLVKVLALLRCVRETHVWSKTRTVAAGFDPGRTLEWPYLIYQLARWSRRH